MLVTNQFMLAMLLQQIAFIKKNPEAIPTLPIERHEAGLLYKYHMMKVAHNGAKTFGDRSNLVRAVKSRLYEEAAMVEGLDPRSTLALMESDLMGEACEQLESKLHSWAKI